jgi:monoamine oxidase
MGDGRNMLDVAIVGGGLSGLALAKNLHRRARGFAIFEARNRLGGRILTVAGQHGGGVDLGAAWFWPETQPLVTQLIKELGLDDFPQPDEGTILHLQDADKKATRIEGKRVYDGAKRLHGGTRGLIDGLAKQLPTESIFLQHELTRLQDCGDHIALAFNAGEQLFEITARHVVLAMPPRLVREHIEFAPRLDEPTEQALLGAETWMAAQAKVVLEYRDAFWLGQGLSGSAFVTHDQAIIGEIYDASDSSVNLCALGGFLALGPELRETFSAGLPMLLSSQVSNVFGKDEECLRMHYQDWAAEAHTCSAADRIAQKSDHSGDSGNPMLRRSFWDKKLYFGGSETAAHGAGYLEGALDAARRIDRALVAIETKRTSSNPLAKDAFNDLRGNDACLVQFVAWVETRTDAVFDDYRRRLNRILAAQQRESLTQIAVLGAMEEVFQQALGVLDDLPFDMKAVVVERGRSSLTPGIQKPFGDLMQALIDDVIAFNQTSCALSNFPSEHKLSRDYLQAIMQDIAAAWREFSLSANRLLLEKTRQSGAQEKIG